jgi:oligoendopeptidase F
MPVAETASIFNETHFLLEQVAASGDPEEKLGLLDGFLMNSGQVICDILSRFLFEQEVFHRVEKEVLKPEDLKDIMHRAQLEAYGDGLDPDSLHPYMWACKPHYYSAGLSFYNFPYAFGALFAAALYRKAGEEGAAFMEQYDRMLTATTVSTVEEAGRLTGLEFTDKAVWENSMASFLPFVSAFEELTETLAP